MFNFKANIILGCALALLSNATYSGEVPKESLADNPLSSLRTSSLKHLPRGEENESSPVFSKETKENNGVFPREIFERLIRFSSQKKAKKALEKIKELSLNNRTMRKAVLRTGHLKPINTMEDSQLINLLIDCGNNLRSLDLNFCRHSTAEAALITVSQNCRNLTSLELEECYMITPETLIAVSQNCRNLTSLDLRGCDQITPEALITVSQNCRILTSLDLSFCRLITPEALIAVSQNCPNLTSLNLRGCDQITPEALITVLQNCRNLTSLDLASCKKITGKTIRKIKKIRPGIEISTF
jgi:hypothetical protein